MIEPDHISHFETKRNGVWTMEFYHDGKTIARMYQHYTSGTMEVFSYLTKGLYGSHPSKVCGNLNDAKNWLAQQI